MNPSKFFNRKINIRNPKTPYQQGKFVDESQNYSNRISSRINQSPLTKSLFSLRNKVFQIENLLNGIFSLDKKRQEQGKKIKAAEVPDKKPKTKVPQIFGKLIQRPKTGALDLIRDFVTFTFLGWLFTKIQPLLGGLTKLGPLLEGMAWFIGGTIKNMVDVFATFLKLGFDAKEKFDNIVADIKKNTKGIDKTFDATLNPLKAVFDGVIQLANSFLITSVKADELNEAKTQLSKEQSADTVPAMPSLPKVDEPRMPQTSDPFPTPQTNPGVVQKFNTGGVIRGYNEGGRIDPRTPVTRGVETQRREVPKPKPIIQPQKTAPGKDVGGDKKIKQLYDQTGASSIADFIPLPSFFRSDKKSGFAALTGASEEYKKPMTNDILGIGNMMGASVDSALGQKIEKKSYTQFADGIKYLVNYGRTQPEEFAKIDLEDMVRKIVEPKVNMAINRIQEEINKKSAVELPPSPGEGGYAGGEYGGYAPTSGLEKEIYDYLINVKKMNDIQALGLMANISRESSFIPNNREPGGTGVGLFQWSHDRVAPFIRAVPDWETNWKAQIDYALSEPKNLSSVAPGEYQSKNFSSAQEAADWWMNEWERPRDKISASIKHQQYLANVPRSPEGTARFRSGITTPPGVIVEGGTLPSTKLGSKAGWRWGRPHNGNDYPLAPGTPISVVVGGEIVYSGSMGGYGNTIDILHPDGSKTRYAHLQDIKVRVGQKVSAGMIIGTVGYTGRTVPAGPDGSHLHFEYFYPNGNRETNWQKLNNIADRKFRFGGNVKPTEVQKLAKKDGKEGYINPQGTFVERRWTPEEKRRFENENIKKTASQQLQTPRQPPRTPLSGPLTPLASSDRRGFLINNQMYYVDLKTGIITNAAGYKIEVGPGSNEALGKAILQRLSPADRQKLEKLKKQQDFKNIPWWGRMLPGISSIKPVLPAEKYVSYNQPDSQEPSYIQLVIKNNPIPVPVSSGPVAFVKPGISNSTSQLV